jgi:hypothetical protein
MYTRARTFFSFFSGIVAGRGVKSSDLVKRVFVVVVCVCACVFFFGVEDGNSTRFFVVLW